MTLKSLCVVLFALGFAARVLPASAGEQDAACTDLIGLADAAPDGPLFLASYPTVDAGPLHAAAFTYDNAVAVIALIGCGRRDLAQRIGDALLAALDRDRFWHDGRLRNAYAAGPVAPGPVKLPGWWDATLGRWLEDRYQAGTDSGNMAWAMLALLALDRAGAHEPDRDGAARIGAWVAGRRDLRGSGGFIGGTFGHEPAPVEISWKSTEHNTDLAAAFHELADATGDPLWQARAAAAARFVATMWDAGCSCFAAGTTDDGVTHNPTLALDAQLWPLLALPDMAPYQAAAFATAERRMRHGEIGRASCRERV